MKFCPDSIQQIVEILQKGQLTYNTAIIIGDNSSGKSLLVKQLVQRVKDKKGIYFIDAVNRGFDVTKVTRNIEKPEYKDILIETRTQEPYFNIQDSFNCYGTSTERVEQIYTAFEKKVQALFKELTNDEFQIKYGDPFGEVHFNEGNGLLSSGYQAMIRLLLELVYYEEMGIKANHLSNAWVVIDELDEFLSPRYAAKILGFLKKIFTEMRFVITTHSIDLVLSAQDANIIILDGLGYEVIDANDYNSFSEVQRVFQRVFGKQEIAYNDIETSLRRLLNNKMNGAWSKDDEKELQRLEKQHFTASQGLIFKQIVEW